MAKIYLSAAAHAKDNPTKCLSACGENIHCNEYMDMVEARLKSLGFSVKRGDKSKTGSIAMQSRVKEANKWGADVYYVAHTNAGGGRYSMTLCWNNAESKRLANVIHKYRRCVTSHKVRARSDLYEIKATAMPCLYDELFFHDSAEDCAWFHNGGMQALAEETVQALCEICGVAYASSEAVTATKPHVGDAVRLDKGKLYVSSTSSVAVTRSGTYYLYDGKAINGRYRVTNAKERVGKTPLALNVSGWVAL